MFYSFSFGFCAEYRMFCRINEVSAFLLTSSSLHFAAPLSTPLPSSMIYLSLCSRFLLLAPETSTSKYRHACEHRRGNMGCTVQAQTVQLGGLIHADVSKEGPDRCEEEEFRCRNRQRASHDAAVKDEYENRKCEFYEIQL